MTTTEATRPRWSRIGGLLPQRSDWVAVRRAPRRDLVAGLTVAAIFGGSNLHVSGRTNPTPLRRLPQ